MHVQILVATALIATALAIPAPHLIDIPEEGELCCKVSMLEPRAETVTDKDTVFVDRTELRLWYYARW